MKLFAVYVGGATKNSNIELHDVRFVIAEKMEDTYEELRKQWWGVPSSLHIDCWSEITQADGYAVSFEKTPSSNINKLYFVNLGGYIEDDFSEVHKNVFVVAETESKAKVRALKTVRHWQSFHKDEMYEVEKTFCLDKAAKEKSLYIHLTKIADESPAPFVCKYLPIGKRKTS